MQLILFESVGSFMGVVRIQHRLHVRVSALVSVCVIELSVNLVFTSQTDAPFCYLYAFSARWDVTAGPVLAARFDSFAAETIFGAGIHSSSRVASLARTRLDAVLNVDDVS